VFSVGWVTPHSASAVRKPQSRANDSCLKKIIIFIQNKIKFYYRSLSPSAGNQLIKTQVCISCVHPPPTSAGVTWEQRPMYDRLVALARRGRRHGRCRPADVFGWREPPKADEAPATHRLLSAARAQGECEGCTCASPPLLKAGE
jgi:hypothetical protein